jgi:predicted permease
MSGVLQDLRYAVRSLRKSPGFTAVAIATLALGIGANTAIFAVVHSILLRPLPYFEPERLVRFDLEVSGFANGGLSPQDFEAWPRRDGAFQAFAGYSTLASGVTLTGRGEAELLRTTYVTGAFFETLGVSAEIGRVFRTGEDRPGTDRVVVLSHSLWEQRFGADPVALGAPAVLNDQPFTVIGVMPAGFRDPAGGADAWVLQSVVPETSIPRQVAWLHGIARLAPGLSLRDARARAQVAALQLLRESRPAEARASGLLLEPLREFLVAGSRRALFVLLGAVGLVFLIACSNVASLTLARNTAREKEFALRTALGAGRSRVVRQILTESLLLALLGGAAGCLLAVWSDGLARALAHTELPRADEIGADAAVLAFGAAATAASALLFGLLPALHTTRRGIAGLLREGAAGSGSPYARKFRLGLVVAQIALAIVLLAAAGLLVRSLAGLRRLRPGLDPERLLTVRLTIPASRYPERNQYLALQDEILDRLARLPGVRSVGAIKSLPIRGSQEQVAFRLPERPAAPRDESFADFCPVTPGYLSTVGMTLLAGRLLDSRDDARTEPVTVASRAAARAFWPDEDPVGHAIEVAGAPVRVVGVVENERGGAIRQTRPAFYFPQAQASRRVFSILLRTAGEAQNAAAAARAAIREADPTLAIAEIAPLERVLEETLGQPRLLAGLLLAFGAVALGLATVGVFGLLSYAVTSRRRELAIRAAVGARASDLLRSVFGESVRCVLPGVALGTLGALASTRALRGLLFEVPATDPVTIAAASLCLALAAFLATLLPARRATRIDPMDALRRE